MMNEKFINAESGEMKVEGYKAIYEAVTALSMDADGYGLLDSITDEDVEKCKWIASIYEVLDDVPMRRVKHVFNYRNVDFDRSEFVEENGF